MEFAPLLFWVHVKKKWSKNKRILTVKLKFLVLYTPASPNANEDFHDTSMRIRLFFLVKIFWIRLPPPPFKQKTTPPACTQPLYYFPSQGYTCELYCRNITERIKKLGVCCIIAQIYSGIIQVAPTGKNQCTSVDIPL